MPTRTRNPENKLKVITLPNYVMLHYQEQATAEVQSLSALLRAIIMRDYNGRIASPSPTDPPAIIKPDGGVNHQITLPTAVHDFYKRMAKTNGVGLMAILRTIIVSEYLSSLGLPAEGEKVVKDRKVVLAEKFRGLIEASEEPTLKLKGRKRQGKKES